MIVGFDDHGDAVGTGVITEFAQSRRNSGLGLFVGHRILVSCRFPAEDTDIRGSEVRSEVNETARICQFLRPLLGIIEI